jgi:hypothetical protein
MQRRYQKRTPLRSNALESRFGDIAIPRVALPAGLIKNQFSLPPLRRTEEDLMITTEQTRSTLSDDAVSELLALMKR